MYREMVTTVGESWDSLCVCVLACRMPGERSFRTVKPKARSVTEFSNCDRDHNGGCTNAKHHTFGRGPRSRKVMLRASIPRYHHRFGCRCTSCPYRNGL